ncbi:MAG: hypothetical protein ACJA09_001600 [Alcanivorax sp.]|jgi:hypothetical protein
METVITKPALVTRLLSCMLLLCSAVYAEKPTDASDGQLYRSDGKVQAWSASGQQWLSVEEFWRVFTETNDGRFLGRSADYPPYGDLKERDALLVELEQGSCLMYFWHGRWRRAQDVWRWDDEFNEQLGCPYVFE